MGGRFTVLGSGTAVPVAGRGPAGHLLEAGGERVLFDSGSGTLQRLRAAGVTLDALDRVFYTHYHLDHLIDLPALLFALKDPALDRDRELPVHGPPGLERIVAGLRGLFGAWLEPEQTRPVWHEVAPGWAASFPFGRVITGATRHVPGSLAYRIELEGGGVVVYSGDTGYSEGVARLARGADLFVCECAWPEAKATDLHLSPALAGRLAARAGVRRLVLTHFYPQVLATDIEGAARAHFQGPLTLAEDLMSFAVAAGEP